MKHEGRKARDIGLDQGKRLLSRTEDSRWPGPGSAEPSAKLPGCAVRGRAQLELERSEGDRGEVWCLWEGFGLLELRGAQVADVVVIVQIAA